MRRLQASRNELFKDRILLHHLKQKKALPWVFSYLYICTAYVNTIVRGENGALM